MNKVSQELIMEIRDKVNIVDVIGEYLSLTQKGKNYFAVCPFHDDHNPSMSISTEKQIYRCFVCGAGGNVYNFLMEYEQISFMEAVQIVARKAGVELPTYKQPLAQVNPKLQALYKIYELSTKYYQNHLNTKAGVEALSYLRKRSFSLTLINEFQIGLAPFNNKLSALLQANNYGVESLVASGLMQLNNNEVNDLFINRIMFPLWDLKGQVVGFSGRTYNYEDAAKYINTKASPLFKKGELLYNYHRAQKEARKLQQVIVVEGFMDVLALYQHGFKNVVATMGTAVTREQAQLLKRLGVPIILCFDGDKAGAMATINAGNELNKIKIKPLVVRLSDNLDPDDYLVKKGLEAFKQALGSPQSFLNFKFDYIKQGRDLSDPQAISHYIDAVIKELSLLQDVVAQELLMQKVSDETGVSLPTLTELLNKARNQVRTKPVVQIKKKRQSLNKYDQAATRLLYYMLKEPSIIKIYEQRHCYFPSETARYLASEMLCFYNKYERFQIADFLSYLGDKKELVVLTNSLLNLKLPPTSVPAEIDDYIKVLDEYVVMLKLRKLENEYLEATNEEVKMKLADEIIMIKKGVDQND